MASFTSSFRQLISNFLVVLLCLFIVANPILFTNSQSSADCEDVLDPGNCTYLIQRYGFDSASRTCVSFNYTGCGGNANNFLSQSQCAEACREFKWRLSEKKMEDDVTTEVSEATQMKSSTTTTTTG